MKFSLSLLTVLLALTFSANAQAANEVVHCGTPVDTHINTDPGFIYCNIYDRQIAYREKRLDLMRQLKERQANFAAPGLETYRKYKQDIEELHDSIESSTK